MLYSCWWGEGDKTNGLTGLSYDIPDSMAQTRALVMPARLKHLRQNLKILSDYFCFKHVYLADDMCGENMTCVVRAVPSHLQVYCHEHKDILPCSTASWDQSWIVTGYQLDWLKISQFSPDLPNIQIAGNDLKEMKDRQC